MAEGETIVALATAPGRASVAIIRLSGTQALSIGQTLCSIIPKPRYAHYVDIINKHGNILDKGLMLFFPAPHSFTGEDILELQIHGSPVVIHELIEYVLTLGARLARPGEFSERAFFNHKIDLTQAEAIADLINAASAQAARNAMQSLEGMFSKKISDLNEKLIHLRMFIEASLDFSEEEINFLNQSDRAKKLENIIEYLNHIQAHARQGVLLQEGMTVVIAGKPNVGKSSLLNQLSGRDSAIVTPIPGTTRDLLREFIQIDGLPLQIIDTAGLRDSEDLVEQEGIKRTQTMLQKADCILYLKDITKDITTDITTENCLKNLENTAENNIINTYKNQKIIVIYNKIDLINSNNYYKNNLENNIIFISAKTGEGIHTLKKYLKNLVAFDENLSETGFSARRRHLDALKRAQEFLEHACSEITIECVAEDLRLAQQALNEITGEFTTEDLLSRIFSSFCIGK